MMTADSTYVDTESRLLGRDTHDNPLTNPKVNFFFFSSYIQLILFFI